MTEAQCGCYVQQQTVAVHVRHCSYGLASGLHLTVCSHAITPRVFSFACIDFGVGGGVGWGVGGGTVLKIHEQGAVQHRLAPADLYHSSFSSHVRAVFAWTMWCRVWQLVWCQPSRMPRRCLLFCTCKPSSPLPRGVWIGIGSHLFSVGFELHNVHLTLCVRQRRWVSPGGHCPLPCQACRHRLVAWSGGRVVCKSACCCSGRGRIFSPRCFCRLCSLRNDTSAVDSRYPAWSGEGGDA